MLNLSVVCTSLYPPLRVIAITPSYTFTCLLIYVIFSSLSEKDLIKIINSR